MISDFPYYPDSNKFHGNFCQKKVSIMKQNVMIFYNNIGLVRILLQILINSCTVMVA